MNRLVRIAVVSLMLAPSVGTAQSFDVGWQSYDNGDFKSALRTWLPLAELGDARAQNMLGIMYADGKGVSQDDAAAGKWHRLSAEQGYAPAQLNLGLDYFNGKSVPRDFAAAVKWFRLSAEQGEPFAQFTLGVTYSKGTGVPQNNVTALMWHNLARANGLPFDSGDSDAALLAPAEVSEAQRRAEVCLASNYRDCD
jgi:uncharacterized protein